MPILTHHTIAVLPYAGANTIMTAEHCSRLIRFVSCDDTDTSMWKKCFLDFEMEHVYIKGIRRGWKLWEDLSLVFSSCKRQWRPVGLSDVGDTTFSRPVAHRCQWNCKPYMPNGSPLPSRKIPVNRLGLASTGPHCAWKDYINKKSQWHHVFNWHCHGSKPQDSVLWPLIMYFSDIHISHLSHTWPTLFLS
jgi:hypothetical protein